MQIVGIIAEYNPLHNGHIYHIERAKSLSGAKHCIVVMSGNFVQRGEPACTDKYTRAAWAVKAGASLVVELPSVYAVATAERFAQGAVRLLEGSGVVTDLAFGCESADMQTLLDLCDIVVKEPDIYRTALQSHMKLGKSYPRARYDALRDYGVSETMLRSFAAPNNILGIEYIRALQQCGSSIRPLCVPRVGSGYNSSTLTGKYSSATAIRRALLEGNPEVMDTVPLFVGAPLQYDEQFPVTQSDIGNMILYALRRMSSSELRELPDVSEGFENVIMRAVRSCADLETFYHAIKNKRFTMARCKRIACCALLGITNELVYRSMQQADSQFLHVLAFSQDAVPLLSELGKRSRIPLLMSNADIRSCSPAAKSILAVDALSSDLFAFASGNEVRRDSQGPLKV